MKPIAALLLSTVTLALAACDGSDGGSGGRNLSRSVCDPSAGPFTLDIDNPFFPLPVGKQLVLDGEEDGEAVHLVITALDQVEEVAGVETRVLEERESADGDLVEVSRNFFTQAPDGSVCYFGEDVDIYEDGVIVDHEGAWRAGVAGASPGIIMPADPRVGDGYDQENAPGVAEDHAEVTAQGESITVPAGTFTDTLETVETTPLEPGTSTKVYASGIGLVKDGELELTSSN